MENKKTTVEIYEEKRLKRSYIVLLLAAGFFVYVLATHEIPFYGSYKERVEAEMEERYAEQLSDENEKMAEIYYSAAAKTAFEALANGAADELIDLEGVLENGTDNPDKCYNSVTLEEGLYADALNEYITAGNIECYKDGVKVAYKSIDFNALAEYDIYISKTESGIKVEMTKH